jgi:hypothetical protein
VNYVTNSFFLVTVHCESCQLVYWTWWNVFFAKVGKFLINFTFFILTCKNIIMTMINEIWYCNRCKYNIICRHQQRTDYLCNQCLSALKLWDRIPLMARCLDTTLCDKVCQWLAAGRWFSLGTLVSFTNKTVHHDIAEKMLIRYLTIITHSLSGLNVL